VDGRRRTRPLRPNLRSVMRLHVVRHADPDYRVDGLTDRGRAEAAALAQWMKRNDEFDVDRIYTSPMGRAVQTAKTIADAIDRNVLVEPWAKELSEWRSLGGTGDAGGGGSGAVWDVDGESVRRAMRIGGAENDRECGTQEAWDVVPGYAKYKDRYRALCEDGDEFLERLGFKRDGPIYRTGTDGLQHHGKGLEVVLVCHMGMALTWLSHLLALPTPLCHTGFFLPPSSVTTILFEQRNAYAAVPRIIRMGCTAHLYKAGIKPHPKPAGIQANYY